jgi:predicted transcriptional regulator
MAMAAATVASEAKRQRMVRISDETHELLTELAAKSGESMTVILARAVDAHYRERFFAEFNAAYERLWADPEAAREELEERALWEATLADGLEDE